MPLRPRMIDESLWSNESVMNVPIQARLLYIGTISISDDYGRLKAGKRQLKAQVFPSDDVTADQVGEWFDCLAVEGLLIPYEVDGSRYAVHPHWFRYQHQRATHRVLSKIPEPPKDFNLGEELYNPPPDQTPEALRKKWRQTSDSGSVQHIHTDEPPDVPHNSQTHTPDVPQCAAHCGDVPSKVREGKGRELGTPSISPPPGEDTPLADHPRRTARDRVEASPHHDYLVKLGRWFVDLPHTISVEIDSNDWWRSLDSCRTILDTQMDKVPSPDSMADPQDRLRRLLRFAVADTEFWQAQIRSLHGLAQKKPNGLPKWANIEVAATTPPTRSKAAGEARRAIPEASAVLADRPPAADPNCGCDGGWQLDRNENGNQVPCEHCARGKYYTRKRRGE